MPTEKIIEEKLAEFERKLGGVYFLDSDDGQEMFLRAKDNKTFFSIRASEEIKSFLRTFAQSIIEARDGEVRELLKKNNTEPFHELLNAFNRITS